MFFEESIETTEERISEIENQLLQQVFACRTTEAVESAVTYARFLSSVGITPDNYPIFLRMLEIENRWVIDELIGDRDPFLLLSSVQPNRLIVSRIFAMMTKWHKGGIYAKNLSVILGVLQSVYSSPADGYRIYPLSIADVNALGKHLDKPKGQDDPLNRAILEVLEKIASLEDAGNPGLEEVAIHASAVRNAFFDDRKHMEDVIPPVLLITVGDRKEVAPRSSKELSDAEQSDPGSRLTTSMGSLRSPAAEAKTAPKPKAKVPPAPMPPEPAGEG